MLEEECSSLGVRMGRQAIEVLLSKVNGNSRLLLEEARKLATYLGDEGDEITSELIEELTPNFGEGDFFESTEAFFSRNIKWTLDALRRHFFSGNDARPVIASLQNRNRLMIQIRSLMDGGEISLGYNGFDKGGFSQATAKYSHFYRGDQTKSNYNAVSYTHLTLPTNREV